ncbi:putative bifunctional diguanylate cyclase/phosphodiesterase [Fictibacillus gelatini]|uniref:putative bifunctional diguanylate cyclase/phosphodiesterase n=1 Tax=Fictibacillus gelatini TaxID=225985 RepID=UPI00041E9C0D|nr:EAL domain-containing protein [Fictibacillus gelatini]
MERNAASGNRQNTQELEVKLRDVENKFRTIMESINDAIVIANSEMDIISWNSGAERLFGHKKTEIIGKKLTVIMPDRFQEAHKKGMTRFLQTKEPKAIGRTVELVGKRKEGTEFPLELSIGTWETDDEIYFSGIIRDITERKRAEEQINQMAYYDPLTGLPNRRLFEDRLLIALEQAQREEQEVAVMFIDLDRFKFVNDTLGHAFGDALLKEVAKALLRCLRKGDTVSRQGGDEFCLLLPAAAQEDIATISERILYVFSSPFRIEDHEIFITPSIGISLYPHDGADPYSLMKNADTALYRAKECGRNTFQLYTAAMNDSITKRVALEKELRKALEKKEFELHFQPQVNIETGALIGFEALLRWRHGQRGNIPPDQFIPLAEETGLIIPISEWVLREACKQNKDWHNRGFPRVPVSVNLSAIHMKAHNLVATIAQILKETNLDPCYLELEITESGAMENAREIVDKLRQLKDMGIKISIDDFGTGYSSLGYLKRFPIDTLKIDRSFIWDLEESDTAAIMKTIIALAQSLKLKVIAEGVETEEQLSFLQDHLCDRGQGYFFSKPLPADEIEKNLFNYTRSWT